MRAVFIALATALFLTACGQDAAEAPVADGFIRLPAPGANMTAAYLTISRDEADRLVSVSIEGVERTEFHIAFEENGIARMRQVEAYDIAADEALVMEPGGRHMMLFGLTAAMDEDQTRLVSLRFASGAEDTVSLPIKRSAGQHNGH